MRRNETPPAGRSAQSIFFIMVMNDECPRKCTGWPVLKNEAVVVPMPPDQPVVRLFPQKPLALEADVGD